MENLDRADKKQVIAIDAEVDHKIKIVRFGLKYGYKAAIEAFSIGKSTYYNYVKDYKKSRDITKYKAKI